MLDQLDVPHIEPLLPADRNVAIWISPQPRLQPARRDVEGCGDLLNTGSSLDHAGGSGNGIQCVGSLSFRPDAVISVQHILHGQKAATVIHASR